MDRQGTHRPVQAVADHDTGGVALTGPRHAHLAGIAATLRGAPAVQRIQAMAPPNRTGMSDRLKAGIESLSGMSLDAVRVHRNSARPAQLGAYAYAQGTDIHLGPGQDRHLPHEAWHVVQQAQGRVRPTMQMKLGIGINDDAGLEREADRMGARAAAGPMPPVQRAIAQPAASQRGAIVQCALPITKAAFYLAHQATIDADTAHNARNAGSITIMRNIEYVAQVVKPFLENRREMVIAYHLGDKPEQYWAGIEKKLKMIAGFQAWAAGQQNLDVFALAASDAEVAKLVVLADSLLAMHTVPAAAGGYAADAGIRGGMPDLQRILSSLPSGAVAHSGTPQVEGLDLPIVNHGDFMASALVPPALKRLVNDIHLHWRHNAVLDTRSPAQQAQRATTPDEAGALRSWHFNGHHSLPALNQPAAAHPLHAHYANTSQAGNVHAGAGPIGYAEYTGIDSDQNKVILDYVNGHIFVTAVHYKYWYDTPGKAPLAESGSLAGTRGAKPDDAELAHIKSPWIQVRM
jgi:hypothetical protein